MKNSALRILHSAFGSWLPDMDLNHDKQIQSLLCYHYTMRQSKRHQRIKCRPVGKRVFAAFNGPAAG